MASAFFDPLVGGNGTTVTDDADPVTGLRRGGYKVRFVPALQQFVTIANNGRSSALTASAAAATATTQAGIATGAASSALTSSQGAQIAREATEALADDVAATAALVQAVSGARAFATYALALAAVGTLDPNQVVIVAKDETRNNLGSYYQVVSNALVFLRAEEAYISPVSYIPSQPINDVLTMLLVRAGLIPQDNPTLFADLGSDAYFA